MSRNPGIGDGYVDKYAHELIAHDNVIVNGREVSLPRFYDRKLLSKGYVTDDERLELKDSRSREMRKLKKDYTPQRLRVREKFEILKAKTFTKGEI